MAQKHLHELLKENQEPFHLKEYIAYKRSQINGPSPKISLQVKKRHPTCESSNFPRKLCQSSCLFSFKDTPDHRKSPLFEYTPLSKSPCKSPRILLHISTRTSPLLLEAALRIHKQSYSAKSKNPNKNHGFGFLGSVLKRLTPKNRTQKREIKGEKMKVSVKDILRWDSSVGREKFSDGRKKVMLTVEDNHTAAICPYEVSFSCSCNGRPGGAIWSESMDEKSLDMEASTCSSLSEGSEEMDFITEHKKVKERACYGDNYNTFCESPFRFVLQRSPSPAGGTPEFHSPTMSPIRRTAEDKSDNGGEGFKKLQTEEEEQFSPVSVLDASDYDGRHNDDEEYQAFDMQCSYATVQKIEMQLLHKLVRFEKLAEIDPVELEKIMLDQDKEDDNEIAIDEGDVEVCSEDHDRETSDKEMNLESFSNRPSSLFIRGIPSHMKRLVPDLISEEERQVDTVSHKEEIINRLCKKIELWTHVESNTIDMMVEQDFRSHTSSRKNHSEHESQLAMEIEHFTFNFLMDDLVEELASMY